MNSGKLILVRHGLSVYNDQNRFTGWKDVELNEQGINEAKQAVNLLEEINFDMAFTSNLKRANDTLDLILKGIEQDIPIEKNLALNERDYGDEEHGDEEEEHDEHEGERIFSATDSDVFDLKGSFNFYKSYSKSSRNVNSIFKKIRGYKDHSNFSKKRQKSI